MRLPDVLLVTGGALWLCWALATAYLLVLTCAAALRRGPRRSDAVEARRLCVLIPAHDEELVLGTVLDRLRTLAYPAENWSVVVIADNCSDGTAAVAGCHGAEVLERTDADQRGKGFALAWAIERLLRDRRGFDAFIVMDADSVLSERFLAVMNAALADGHQVVQGRYDVLNPDDTWRTRLMACALALAHHVKPLGRGMLGLSDGLKGNGMCFARAVLERVPWSGESITEDIEYTLRLAEAGVRVEYAPDAVVRAQMPTTGEQAATQRERWEGGRYALLRRALGLLGRGAVRRNWVLADRAVELVIPPLTELMVVPVLCAGLSAAWALAAPSSPRARLLLAAWAGVLAAQVLYLAVGLAVARVPWSTASALALAPAYVAWKLCLYAAMAARRGAGGWKRTERRAM